MTDDRHERREVSELVAAIEGKVILVQEWSSVAAATGRFGDGGLEPAVIVRIEGKINKEDVHVDFGLLLTLDLAAFALNGLGLALQKHIDMAAGDGEGFTVG